MLQADKGCAKEGSKESTVVKYLVIVIDFIR
jgi:hypothetical protein